MIDWKRAGGCLLIIAACLAIDAAAVAVMFQMLLAPCARGPGAGAERGARAWPRAQRGRGRGAVGGDWSGIDGQR